MKKFYFLLVAMLIGFSASALDYYLIGGFQGWTLKDASCKFTDQGDGTYVLDYNGTLTSGFKINDGTWSNNNANFGGSSTLTVGVPYNLTLSGTAGDIPLKENINNPHLVFNPTAKTLLITGQSVEAKVVYGIHGSIFGNSNWSTENFTKQSDDVWVMTDKTIVKGDFGIKGMDEGTGSQVEWIFNNGGATTVQVGQTYACVKEGNGTGGNWAISAGTYTFTFNSKNMTLTVTGTSQGGDEPGPTPEIDYTKWYLNVQGDFNTWTPSGVAFNADGIAEDKNLAIGAGEFELKIWDGSADSYWGTYIPVQPGEETTVTNGGGHMTIAGAAAGDVYNVTYNAKTNIMVVTKVGGGDEPGPDPDVFYKIHGQITGNANWESVEMTNNNGVWEYTGALVAGEFGIRKTDASDNQLDWIGGGANISEAAKTYSFVAGSNSSSTLEGNYTIKYNPTAKTIEFVEAGEIEHVIGYTLRGNIVTGEWADYPMTEENGAWIVTLNAVPGEFGIKKTDNGAQAGWYAAPSAAESNVDKTGSYQAGGIGTTNWASTLEGEYKFSFNPDTEILSIDFTSGVETIVAEEEVEAVYYNLQGVRVAEPAQGLYIVVRGNKVTKEIVR